MPAFTTFSSGPNQISNLTSGWTPKIIYSFQMPDSAAPLVAPDGSVFGATSGIGGSKGSISLLASYFEKPNINSGRTIKITMYFRITQANSAVNLKIGLDEVGVGKYLISPSHVGSVSNDGNTSYCRFECFLNVYDTGTNIRLQVNGGIIFPYNSTYDTRATSTSDITVLTNGYVPYDLYIESACASDIYPSSIIVEEIG